MKNVAGPIVTSTLVLLAVFIPVAMLWVWASILTSLQFALTMLYRGCYLVN
ncbi:hypothetical protein O9993_00555 [Vibrio lentus]|nr:hypothetical protein [Vibrio lentus]